MNQLEQESPLRRFRSSLKLSQEQFGMLFDPPLKQARLSQYELGHRPIPVEIAKQAIKIAKRKRKSLSLDQIYYG